MEGCLTFFPKKQLFIHRGSVLGSLSFSSGTIRRTQHARSVVSPSLGLHKYTRAFFRSRRVRVSKHTLRPLSIGTTCLFSRPRRRRHLGGGKTSSRWENLSTDRQLLVFSLLTIVGLIGKSMSEHESARTRTTGFPLVIISSSFATGRW